MHFWIGSGILRPKKKINMCLVIVADLVFSCQRMQNSSSELAYNSGFFGNPFLPISRKKFHPRKRLFAFFYTKYEIRNTKAENT
jgi:hypothetical protein